MAIFTDTFNIFCSFWLYEMFSTQCFQHVIKESWLSRQVEFCIWNNLFSVLHTFHTPKHKVINKHGWLTWEVDLISEFTTHIIKKTPICSLKQPVLLQGQPTLCNQPLNILKLRILIYILIYFFSVLCFGMKWPNLSSQSTVFCFRE